MANAVVQRFTVTGELLREDKPLLTRGGEQAVQPLFAGRQWRGAKIVAVQIKQIESVIDHAFRSTGGEFGLKGCEIRQLLVAGYDNFAVDNGVLHVESFGCVPHGTESLRPIISAPGERFHLPVSDV